MVLLCIHEAGRIFMQETFSSSQCMIVITANVLSISRNIKYGQLGH